MADYLTTVQPEDKNVCLKIHNRATTVWQTQADLTAVLVANTQVLGIAVPWSALFWTETSDVVPEIGWNLDDCHINHNRPLLLLVNLSCVWLVHQ